ncbi:non-motor actin binding protein [Lithospermum erythrorhizon]|uniref:Non-motor actin binding protein n=1 Tax=Lithospermum erythrorhizon TaxID=34254 RepID=A0AAV3Q002_LITER
MTICCLLATSGKFEVEEVYNFSQDDLLTEDVLILDTHAEVFVWVGQSSDPKEKQKAFEMGQRYIEMGVAFEGLCPNVPLYKIVEGNEPDFFTTFFSWDPAKSIANGNSFQKKVLQLFGAGPEVKGRSNGTNQGGSTQRASALAALNSAFNSSPVPKPVSTPPKAPATGQGSQRAAAVAALSQVLTAEKKGSQDGSPPRPSRGSSVESKSPATAKSEGAHSDNGDSKESPEAKDTDETVSPVVEINGADSESKPEPEPQEQDESGGEIDQTTFPYEQLKAKSENPVTGIDFKRREAYLSDEEFQTIFAMGQEAFYKLPKWKQDMLKRKVDLF